MPRRTWTELAALYADNTAGDISAADLRDGFDTVAPHTAVTAPGVTNDEASGFDVGHAWIDTTGPSIYECVDASVGAAVWALVYPPDLSAFATATGFTDMVALTQAAYDALGTPDANTLYFIT